MLVLHVLAFSPAEVLIQKRVSLVRIYFGDKLLELPFKLLVKTVEGNGNVCLPVFIFWAQGWNRTQQVKQFPDEELVVLNKSCYNICSYSTFFSLVCIKVLGAWQEPAKAPDEIRDCVCENTGDQCTLVSNAKIGIGHSKREWSTSDSNHFKLEGSWRLATVIIFCVIFCSCFVLLYHFVM